MRAIWAWLAAFAALCGSESAMTQTLRPAPELVLPILAGERFTLDSDIIAGRRYHIHVRLPEGYAADAGARYPVVYILDGDSALPMLAPLHLFMTYEDWVPEVIMVGIGYGTFSEGNYRSRDYRAPVAGVVPDGGGAPAFARMLQEELVPQIEARFRTDPARRILVGQSMGGQFLLWSAWNEPDAWWARIVSNAALGASAPQFMVSPRAFPPGSRHLIYASGTRDRPNYRAEALAFRAQWNGGRILPWHLTMVDIPEGTHAADLGRAYRYAMRLLFPEPTSPIP